MRGTKVLVPLGAGAGEAAALAARLAHADGVWCEVGQVAAAVHQLRAVRAAASEKGLPPLAAVACLTGRSARVGALAGGVQELIAGQRVTFSLKATAPDGMIPLLARELARDVTRGERLAAGALELEVDEVRGAELRCRVITGGRLTAGQTLQLPGTERSTPAFHDEDRSALEAALVAGFDWIALPDVRTVDDLRDLRSALRARESDVPLAAVLHPAAPLAEAAALAAAVDALVIDRNALATAVPPEELLAVTEAWIAAGRAAGAVTIVVGGALAGMAHSPRPGPGDLADLARLHAAGVDAVVLDAAAARGPFGIEACGAARRLTARAAAAGGPLAPEDELARGAAAAAVQCGAQVLVVASTTGRTARRIARFRPAVALLALVPRGDVARRLALVHGVIALEVSALSSDEIPAAAARHAQELLLARPGGTLAVVTGDEHAPAAAPLTITLCRVESPVGAKPRKPHSVVVPGGRRA